MMSSVARLSHMSASTRVEVDCPDEGSRVCASACASQMSRSYRKISPSKDRWYVEQTCVAESRNIGVRDLTCAEEKAGVWR
jgi:hypothetical protein